MDIAIRTQNLKKSYKPAHPRGAAAVLALDGLSITVESGAIFGLLGSNGAGKSTTMKILTTLSTPDSGEAWVAGHDVLNEPDKVRRLIGYVAQKSGIDTESTGRENLVLQGQLHGLRGSELKKRADELLARFQLSEAADRPARTLSGGMQRKLDIALGLIHRPRVLFLDEPTTGLDPESRSRLWTLIADLAFEGLTILLTTHYLEEADRLAERVAIVDRGRVVAEGIPEELKGELRGDSVQIDLAEAAAFNVPREALARVEGLRDVMVDRTIVRARADEGPTAVPLMLSALAAAGCRVSAVRLSQPTLDDVYLRHTGRTLVEAEGGN